jgi:peptidyl-tRNA hydrolase, PTH1 family
MRSFFEKFLHKKSEQPEDRIPYLIVGLGNPGREYRANRHNAGFMVVDRLASNADGKFSRIESNALISGFWDEGIRLVLAKPQTYMNLSGRSVASLVRFYKVPCDKTLIIHDDLDLPLGSLRIRPGGGAGGQKGLNSIIQALGTQDFPRLRIGIGRPPGQMDPAAYVLQDFSGEEAKMADLVFDRAVDAIRSYYREGLQIAMNRFNGSQEDSQ